uniref:Uncharacterized protein n=1 Tax=Rhizophora mucronata TaxID=61149 RepID=A0A2P2Q3N5_RHIMU
MNHQKNQAVRAV